MKFAFVILHYMAIQDTIECIESFKNLSSDLDYSLIIVDNCSPDQSGNKLREIYVDETKIHIILNRENAGFAKGNNVGIQFAREKLNADFIVCINNDTEMIQSDFLEKVFAEYSYSKFWVLGPMILTKDGKYVSNPLAGFIRNKYEVENALKLKKKELFYTKLGIDGLQTAWRKVKFHLTKHSDKQLPIYRKVNVALHGSCLVFSPKFFEYFSGFDERTFLYSEENILYTQVMAKEGIMVYSPQIFIYHKEDASTESSNTNKREKKLFIINNEIKSLKVLGQVIDDNAR